MTTRTADSRLDRYRARMQELERENRMLRQALATPDPDLTHWRARAEYWEEEARVLRLANQGWARRADLALVLQEGE